MSAHRSSGDRHSLQSADAAGSAKAPDDANAVVLTLFDLVPDKTGSVVIQTGGQKLWIEVNGYEEVLRRGIAPDDTHSEHFDVSGMDFIKFLNGTTLYYAAEEVHVVLGPKAFVAPRHTGGLQSLTAAIEREMGVKPRRPKFM